MDRSTLGNGGIRGGGGAGMPRAPLEGVIAGVVGLLWAVAGLAVASWAVTTALDAARGFEVGTWALGRAGLELPWSHGEIVRFAAEQLPWVAIAAAVALLLAGSNLRKARVAFRPGNVSQDGKGELRMTALEPRVGRPFDGTIALREARAPGEEFDVTLTALGRNGAVAYRAEHKARTRPGAQGVSLPFRFDVPASAPASDGHHRWRLEFAPAGRRYLGRSAFDVTLSAPSEAEARMARVSHGESRAALAHPAAPPHHPTASAQHPATPPQQPAAPQAQGYVDHIEKLYGALGGKLTDAQREQMRARLAGPEAEAMKRQLEGLRRLKPEHVKLFKWVAIAAFIVFFALPFFFTILGMIVAAIFG